MAEEKSGGICSRACRASILRSQVRGHFLQRRHGTLRSSLTGGRAEPGGDFTGSHPFAHKELWSCSYKSCNRRKSSWPWHRHLIQLAVVPEPLHSFSLEHRPSPKDQKVFQPSRFQRRAVSFGSVNLVTLRPYKDQSFEVYIPTKTMVSFRVDRSFRPTKTIVTSPLRLSPGDNGKSQTMFSTLDIQSYLVLVGVWVPKSHAPNISSQ